jgi:hypothetical protein
VSQLYLPPIPDKSSSFAPVFAAFLIFSSSLSERGVVN